LKNLNTMGKNSALFSDRMRNFHIKFIKSVLALFLSVVILTGCRETPNQRYMNVVETFLDSWFQAHPIDAAWAGLHDYDHLLGNVSAEGRLAERELCLTTLEELDRLNPEKLNDQNRIDYGILERALHQRLFQLDTLREFSWNPDLYIQRADKAIFTLAMQSQVAAEDRVANLSERLNRLGPWLQDAYSSLESASVIHAEMGAQHARALAEFFREDSLFIFFDSLATDIEDQLRQSSMAASEGLISYANRIENNIIPMAERSYRLGPDLYRSTLQYMIDPGWTTETIETQASESVAEIQDQMYAIADTIAFSTWNIRYRNPSRDQKIRVIRLVLDRISEDYTPIENRVSYLNSQLNQLRAFITQHNIILENPPWALQILPSGPYQFGMPYTNIWQLGPLSSSNDVLISLRPIPTVWTTQQRESYFREFNRYAHQFILIHDVLPGTTTLNYYARQYPSVIRSLFPAMPLVKGWGAYAERMMTEEGWGLGNATTHLVQLKRELQVAVDAVLDLQIHSQNISRSDAIGIMTEQSFRTAVAAAEQWRLLQLKPGEFVAAFTGKEDLWALRNDYAQQEIEDFTLLDFHKRILGEGAIPLSDFREFMLRSSL